MIIEKTIPKDIHDSSLYSIQVDESTDVAQLAVLLVIAMYLKKNENIGELLLCHPLTKRATVQEKETLIELKTDSSLEAAFKKKSTVVFWVDVKEEYPEPSCKVFNVLLLFTSTVLVERTFSTYTFIKNKYRYKLSVSSDLRVYLSCVKPDLKKLSSSKQAQG
ncbi:Hypothetical protein CINCED_3A005656 [Cinara cedri]|uniref:Uncharacterized protein n=1 Tax=Cinara cedri TaxID=506608 RepID=A0A5E4N3A4_9HEMI|nr:Hypothetical protein CINCED_3A005656 [Cinara cedri]